ncbi:MAG: hypothetical protein IPO54_09015 [Micavibrio sp.]|nr:hypothetical protein [Micavibrio sp.]
MQPDRRLWLLQFTEGTFIERAYLDQGLLDPKHKKVLAKSFNMITPP